MKEEILQILRDIKPAADFSECRRLIDEKVLDSFDIVQLVGELNDVYGVQITVSDIAPANFNSVDAMVRLVSSLQENE